MNIINLGGHSGCKILLCETNERIIFVRKISKDKSYNNRLETQARKQADYKNVIIKTPKVLRQGFTDEGLFYFDMEYIQGITMAEYMKSIEIGRVRGLVETLVKSIIPAPLAIDKEIANREPFKDKIKELKTKLSSENNVTIDAALDMLDKYSWKGFFETPCHGDLTLENIIVKGEQLYLIDFLDSFYDCFIMDMATLLQDVQTMWAYRHQDKIDINTIMRLIVFRDVMMDAISNMQEINWLDVYYALLLKMLRIYSYTNDEKTYQFLNEKVGSIIEMIGREEKICGH